MRARRATRLGVAAGHASRSVAGLRARHVHSRMLAMGRLPRPRGRRAKARKERFGPVGRIHAAVGRNCAPERFLSSSSATPLVVVDVRSVLGIERSHRDPVRRSPGPTAQRGVE